MAMTLLVGTALGFLTGLGVGGGSLLILWLTLGLGMDQETARSINLLFFLPSALVACCFRQQQGNLNLKKVYPAMIAGAVSAAVFTVLSGNLNTGLMKQMFGILLLLTGIRELLTTPRKQ